MHCYAMRMPSASKVGTKQKKHRTSVQCLRGRIEWTRKERSDGIANCVSVTENTVADTNTNTAQRQQATGTRRIHRCTCAQYRQALCSVVSRRVSSTPTLYLLSQMNHRGFHPDCIATQCGCLRHPRWGLNKKTPNFRSVSSW